MSQHNASLQREIYSQNQEIRDLQEDVAYYEKENKPSEDEVFWTNKYRKATVEYSGRYLPNGERYVFDVRNCLAPESPAIKDVLRRFDIGGSGRTDDEKAYDCFRWVRHNIRYEYDIDNYGVTEYWALPFETLKQKDGDCVFVEEEIYTKEGIKKVGDLKVGELILSYDFEQQKFVYKPIRNIIKKGKLPLKRVHFRNGTDIFVTENHPMIVRKNQTGNSQYIKQHLSDIDLTRWWKRKVPVAMSIPYETKDVEWLNVELCYVIGHFLAEGWVEGGHVSSSGYETIESIIPLLELNNVPFSEYKNNSGVPCIRFLKSNFKDFLKSILTNSFDLHLPEWVFHLPKEKLKAIFDGYYLGDGHREDKYVRLDGGKSNKEYCLSTSSDQFASDLQRIALQLGFSLYNYKQLNHQGVGTKPIWRMIYNPNSYFVRDYGYKKISEVSIAYIEDFEDGEVVDFEVEDTHNFVFKNGIISHNCDSQALLLASMIVGSGVPYWKVRVSAGDVVWGGGSGGHAYVTYYCEDSDEWVLLDTTFFPNNDEIIDRKNYKDEEMYKNTWFSFDTKYAYAKDVRVVNKQEGFKARR